MPPSLRAAAGLGLSYRLKTDEDLPFIERLYRATREEEMAFAGWSEDFMRKFITQQQFAQNRHVELAHPGAEMLLVEQDGEPIGRLYIEDRGAEIWLIDIVLLPESRGQGIGGSVLRDLLELGREQDKPVGLQVVKTNPARHLYLRLGFAIVGDGGEHHRMQWRAGRGDRRAEKRGRAGPG
jgi:ribosomal protein S18 acetylase RimI-like enzyme